MKPSKMFFGIITAILALIALIASAAAPAARVLTPSAGAVAFTNTTAKIVGTLDRVIISGIQPNDATVTVTRVSTVKNLNTSSNQVVTNIVATLICTSGAGTSSNIVRGLYYSDILRFTGVGTNAGTILLEYTDYN